MGTKWLYFVAIMFLLNIKSYAQVDNYKDLRSFVVKHNEYSKTTVAQCSWQLALIKLKTDKKGHVIKYNLLNKATDSLILSYHFLKDYQFPARLKMQNKTFVFCETFLNLKGNCKYTNVSEEQIFQMTYLCVVKQMAEEPKTVFDTFLLQEINTDNGIR